MAGRAEVRCVGPSAQLADRKAGVQRTVNMYLSAVEGLGEGRQFILKSCPGMDHLTAEVIFNMRGMTSVVQTGRLMYIDGATLYYGMPFFADNSGTTANFSNVGTLSTSAGACRFAEGIGVVVIVDGQNGYVFNLTTGLAQITDADWRGSSQVETLDGYFIFVDPGTDQFYISAIDDATSLNALDFSSADRIPDKIVAIRVHRQELYVFGVTSTEVWINSPTGSTFPFQRYQSAPIDVGLVGPDAVVRTADTLYFVGKSERGQALVYRMEGHQPRRISKLAVEEALQAVDLAECRMWSYQTAGAEFLGIDCPGLSSTWVYDLATGEWHERCKYVRGDLARLASYDVATINGRHLMAAYFEEGGGTDNVWLLNVLDPDINTWGPNPLPRERTWPHLVSPSAEPVRYDSLELMCSTGNGGNVSLEISNDGGYTWGSVLWRSLGTTGRFMQRVRWLMLGQARDRVFRIRCSDDVPFNIHGAQLESSP